MTEINLNQHEVIFIPNIPYGRTRQIPVKLGQRHYFVDITKNSASVSVDFYLATDKSKYLTKVALGVWVNQSAILDRNFFDHIVDIKNAQDTLRRFKSKVPYREI